MIRFNREWLRPAAQLCLLAMLPPGGFLAARLLGWFPSMQALTGVVFDSRALAQAAWVELCWLGMQVVTPTCLLAALPFVAAAVFSRPASRGTTGSPPGRARNPWPRTSANPPAVV